MKNKVLLWLDDLRDPMTVKPNQNFESLTWAEVYNPLNCDIANVDVIWVKGYHEFVDYLDKYGIPDGICFDHDLGTEKNGMDCVKYLTIKCMDEKVDIPYFSIQSSNIVGKDNMNSLMNSYHKIYELQQIEKK